jgi:hypothetical protein
MGGFGQLCRRSAHRQPPLARRRPPTLSRHWRANRPPTLSRHWRANHPPTVSRHWRANRQRRPGTASPQPSASGCAS